MGERLTSEERIRQLADDATRGIHGDDYRLSTRLLIEDAIRAALGQAMVMQEGVVVPASRLLAVRDALVQGDCSEVFHQLYNLVPWSDPYAPWKEWEALAAATPKRD